MARIRSLKPELCTDERLADCSPTARLLFILMQPFCDDFGVHPAKVRTLKAETFPYDSFSASEVEAWARELLTAGLLVEFENAGERYWVVQGWASLQKIEKPSRKYPSPDAPESSTLGLPEAERSASTRLPIDDQSTTGRRLIDDGSPADGRKDGRNGGEQKGLDLAETSVEVRPARSKAKDSMPAKTSETWDAYSKGYRERYGADPVRNGKVNGQLARFVDQLPADAAPQVAAFYLSHLDDFYVKAYHSVDLLLRDANKLHTQWATGRTNFGATPVARSRAPRSFEGLDYAAGVSEGGGVNV